MEDLCVLESFAKSSSRSLFRVSSQATELTPTKSIVPRSICTSYPLLSVMTGRSRVVIKKNIEGNIDDIVGYIAEHLVLIGEVKVIRLI